MSIKLTMNGEELMIIQEANPPTIYLDTWASNVIAQDDYLSNKFIKLLNDKKGTLLISDINLFEICRPDDVPRYNAITNMIEQVDQAFIETNHKNVVDKEKAPIFDNDLNFITPACPQEMLKAFIIDHPPFKPFNLVHAFHHVRQHPDKIYEFENNLDFEAKINPTLDNYRNDPVIVSRNKRSYGKREDLNKKDFPHTIDFHRQYMEFLIINTNMSMPNPEWRDLMHTIVPAAYSDLVLLDNRV